jgi:hypothetical protein
MGMRRWGRGGGKYEGAEGCIQEGDGGLHSLNIFVYLNLEEAYMNDELR